MLSGIRVIDCAGVSGAFAGKLLAGMGADVVLVEPRGGHALRVQEAAQRDYGFSFYAAGKRSVTIDRATPAGAALFEQWLASADILIDTDPPGTHAATCTRHPGLIVASITPFGQDGPYREWTSSDLVAQAMGGMLFVSGQPDGPPMHTLGLQAYHQAGVFAALGAIAALLARAETGRGQHVDVSLQAAVAGSLEHVPGFFNQDGRIGRRQGTLHWTRFFRVGRCRDGWVMHCTLGDWTTLREWVKSDGFGAGLDDPRFEETPYRQEHGVEIFDELDRWALQFTVEELYEGAQLRRIPYAAVRAPEDLLRDPHLAARGFFVTAGDGSSLRQPGAPFQPSAAPWRVGPPPARSTVEVAPWTPRAVAPARATLPSGWRPLDGVRVLDLTWVVSGPVTTRLLADLGADVIKIERKDALDFGDRRGGLSGTLMRGKRSVMLDLADSRGADLARRLAVTCDVVVDNFSARVMDNLGLDYATLRQRRADIICLRMSGYGLTGPDRDKVSYGPTLQALTGFTLLMGEPGRPPSGFGYSYSDLNAGNLGALAVVAALYHRRQTGCGQLLDLSQLEAVAAVLGPVLLARSVDAGPSIAVGNASQEGAAAPHGVYPCAGVDRWVAITVFTDDEWQRLCVALGSPAWTTEARFATIASRVEHAGALDAQVTAWTRQHAAEDIMTQLQSAGIAAGRVATAADLCAHDPQLIERRHFVDVPTPEGRTVRIDGPPYILSETPARVSGPGPLLSEHADVVLHDLGLSVAEIEDLRAGGVVG